MTKTTAKTPEAKQARKQARRDEKLARDQERAARVPVSLEREMDANTLAGWLEEFAAGVRNGSVSVRDDEHESVLSATGSASVRIKARRGRKRMRLSMRVVWSPVESVPKKAASRKADA